MATLILIFILLLSLLFLNNFIVIYKRLKRYPLALPPGPKPWPVLGNLPHLGPRPHRSITSLVQIYGPLMYLRLGFVDVVVAASSSVAAQFLKVNDTNFSNRPLNSGGKHIAYNYQDLVFAPYGPRWNMLRKICAIHLFSNKALEDYRLVRQEEVGALTRRLESEGKAAVNVGQLLSECMADVLGRVMIGRKVFSNDNSDESGDGYPKAEEFKSMVVELMVLAGLFNVGDFIPTLDWLDPQGIASKMKLLHTRFDAFLNIVLEEHYNNNSNNATSNKDFLNALISLKDNADGQGGKLTDTDIKALLLDLFAAGTDTSSTTVEWAMAEVIRNPKILKKAQEEMDSIVGQNRLVEESDLAKLPFLQAIVKETLRLHPSTPLSLPRIAAESCEINEYFIPKGTTLLVNVWAIGRDPKVWTDPLEFDPGRFMRDGAVPNVNISGSDFEMVPFGAGRRICTGMRLGLRMVQFFTATLVHAFDWALPDGQSIHKLSMEEAFGLSLQRATPLMVQVKPRLQPHVYSK